MRMRYLAALAILVFDLLISGCRSMEMEEDVTETELSQNIKKGNLKANLYRGLRTVKEGELAGYVLIAEDYFSHTYQLSYFGTGNMGVVKDKAMRLFGSFETEVE